jgi:hypothetical protein
MKEMLERRSTVITCIDSLYELYEKKKASIIYQLAAD